ncbi:putative vacuolar amino acid transporter 1 protein [Phaeoacremonium minimum UCRPA7]|uniref:Putative vacuolar amino acid transporter 1 protein n=1 Tax=Phaeoacremonium minimum (strain UCR-PA7) TaxID=1286976 RepID=R8BU42_PHAM7|nr:putative vacuolar amino acid transporter 1 protein [Phaeoacremonium minimum UCRPA7]EOO02815.1 putative vacuolar amino acid transporter 1 protein [Phaeoacremonium minimum UCRPA7]
MSSRNPSTWDEYDRGGSPDRTGSISSTGGRSVQFDDDSYLDQAPDGEGQDTEWHSNLRRRRSSVTRHLAALTDLGGVNSIRSFTRSWQRAAAFAEVIPQRPSFVFAPDQEPTTAPETIQYGRGDVERGQVRTSLLREHLEASPSENAIDDDGSYQAGASDEPLLQRDGSVDFRDRERKALSNELGRSFSVSSGANSNSIFAIPPHLATPPLIGSYGSYRSYGTIESDVSRESMAHAGALWRQQQEAGANVPDGEVEPILVKEVEQDGKIILAVEGQSTLPQTIFNSTNVLIGVGLLSLPMGIKYAGWLCGMVILFLSATVTAYTARLLAKCMDLDPSLITFSDLAFISFGRNARIATSVLFTLELLAACVALIVLFADSLDLLFPGILTVTEWKVICAILMIPLNFLPLRFLSFTSIIGILCCFSIVLIVIIDGLIKPHSPGSLIEPAKTYLFPDNWLTLPLSFGLLMSPWGGHSIYRDMRHPYKYNRAVKITFSFTYLLDATTAVVGILMFGDGVMDAITSNILSTSGYPRVLTFIVCALIAIIPLTKIPLNARPIISTAEVLLGLHQQTVSDNTALTGRSMYFRGVMKIVIRVATIVVFLVISILFPAFDSIMAFMGSALCFTICVTLPVAFYLKLFGHEISPRERIMDYIIITICGTLSLVGTVWAFLPKSLIGAE